MEHAARIARKARSSRRASTSSGVATKTPTIALSPVAPAGRCACDGACPRCKSSKPLALSSPDAAHEREADRVATAVANDSPISDKPSALATSIQRSGAGAASSDTVPNSVTQVLEQSGRSLEPAVRSDMEARFGYDFADVRVHLGSGAAQSARDIDADAYASGRDIVFGANQYQPHTPAGRRLLAHELTHVVQQNGAPSQQISRYRTKGKDTIAFDAANETLTNRRKQPWIESITISFDKVAVDDGHKADAKAAGQIEPRMPTGTVTAKYSGASSSVPADIVLPIVGGSTMLGIGLTDRVKKAKVKRLEGLGYTDSQNIRLGNLTDPVAKSGKGARYSKSGAGTMNYAIFFKGIQAIHEGLLNTASHACVHVGDRSKMRDMNYHTRIGVTEVTVTYSQSVLDDLCCHRKKTGNTSWNANPCESTKCP